MYRPPFTVTPEVLRLAAEIARLVGRLEGLPSAVPQPKLRKRNRVRTIRGTLAIEGAGLPERQVTALLEGKRVMGGRRQILEVTNAVEAYARAPRFRAGRVGDLLAAHAVMMHGLIVDAGRFRAATVGVVKGSRVAHMAPPARRVPELVAQLFEFVRREREVPALVKAAVVHYELEFIHPFTDGNGRIGRLWQHRVALDAHPIFAHVPVESVIRDRQRAYYAALGAADRAGEATPFVAFALQATHDALLELTREIRPERATGAARLARARAAFGRRTFARGDYMGIFPALSAPTASRDLRDGVDDGSLSRTGDKATTRYRFRAAR